jgi:hypothetical protein
MLIEYLDNLPSLPVDAQKESFPIHHTGDGLTYPFGWPKGNDVSTD